MSDLSRREMIVLTTAACACCALGADDAGDKPGPGGGGGEREKFPPQPKQFEIGKLSDYPKVGYYDQFRKNKVMIAVVEDRLVAMSAVCTHKNCIVRKDTDTTLLCPCHKSIFGDHGTPTEGKAKFALPRYALSQAADGTITVDTTQSFSEREWEKPEASLVIKK